MNYDLLLEIGTILSIVALLIPVLAACGAFKSRRQRELDAAFKLKLRQGAKRPAPLSPPLASLSPVSATALQPPASTSSGAPGIEAYNSRLRSRSKAFDTAATTSAAAVNLHAAERTQRRFRRTRCIIRHHAKNYCPHCGYLL